MSYEGYVRFADDSVISLQCFEGRCQECPDAHDPDLEGPPTLENYHCEHGCDHREVNPAADARALDDIAEMLRDPEWGVGMLEDIAGLVGKTGRSIEDYPDGRSTWGRH